MSNRQVVRLAVALLTLAVAAACSQRSEGAAVAAPGAERIVPVDQPVPDLYLVRLGDATAPADVASVASDVAAKTGATVLRTYARAMRGFSMRASVAAAGAVALDPRVVRVEQDAVARAAQVILPPPETVLTQWSPPSNLDRVDQHAPALDDRYQWAYGWNGANVKAYVLDTGVATGHPDFSGRAAFAFDALGEGRVGDCSGHGTHVAGILAGNTYGVAKGALVRSVRVLDCVGNGKVSDVVAGLDWVIANHGSPAVVNLSVFSGASQALDDAVEATVAEGIPVVVAAGDGGKDACEVSPARTPGAIAVAATQQEPPALPGRPPTDVLAPWSDVGDCVDLVAPGKDVVSDWYTGGTLALSGTSMAAPHVAGAIALHLSRYPAATPGQILDTLVANATRAPLGATALTPDRLLFTRGVEYPRALDGAAPTVALTSPADGATVSATVTVTADATDDVAVTRVELLVDGRWRASADAAPYELAWDTTSSLDGDHALTVRAYDAAGNATGSTAVNVRVSNPGVAHWDAALGVPRCETLAASCDSLDLVRGRDQLGPERHAPSVLRDPCAADPAGCVCRDGPLGAYLVDESVERVRVTALDGTPFATGGNVRVDVDVVVGPELGDFLDLYASPAVAPPDWRHVITLEPLASGPQTLTARYTLPAGARQAIRTGLRHGGAAAICTQGGYDERDDLVFDVGSGTADTVPPTIAFVTPQDGAVLDSISDVEVDARDDRLVTNVLLTAVDAATGTPYGLAQLTDAPYRYAWRSALLPNGAYTLRAVAQDGAGQTATDEIAVTLADLAGPVCAITAPAAGTALSSNLLAVDATAEDAGAVARLDLLVDGLVQATDRAAPWRFEVRLPENRDYAVAVRGTDLQGNVTETQAITVAVADRTAPEVKVLSPADQSVVTGPTTFEIQATDASGISKVELFLDGTSLGTWTGAPYTVDRDFTCVPNGSYTFSGTAWDGVGNPSATVRTTVKRNDVAAPYDVVVTQPEPDALLSGNVTLEANAKDDGQVAKIEFWLRDPVSLSESLVATATSRSGAAADSPFQATWAAGTVAAGSWEISAKAYDCAGNATASDPAVPVTTGDALAPVTTVTSPPDGLEWVTGAIRVAADASDPDGFIAKVELRVDGAAFATVTAPPWEATLDTATLANGVRAITSKAYDLAGHATESAPVHVTVTNPGAVLDPVLGVPACDAQTALCHTGRLVIGRGLLGPEPNAPNTVDGCPDGAVGTYEEDESIEHVEISTPDGSLLAGGKPARVEVVAWIAVPEADRVDVWGADDPANPRFELLGTAAPLASGKQTITVDVTLLATARQVLRVALRGGGDPDACGTTGYDDRDDVVLTVEPAPADVTPPVVTLTAPAADAVVNGPVAVAAAATDDVGVARVEFRIDGVAFAEDTTPPYEGTWDPGTRPPGTYVLSAVAWDRAGNSAPSADVPVRIVDAVPPTSTITSPLADDTFGGSATVAVQVAASDDIAVTKVQLLRTNPDQTVTDLGTDTSAPYAFSVSTAGLVDGGTYVLVAKAYDAGGNVGPSAPVAFHVARTGLAAWDRTLRAPKCATAGKQCWTGSLVVGRAALGPEPRAPNTIGGTCADGVAGYFHLDESSDAISVRAPGGMLQAGAPVRIEVKVWATASYPTDRLDVFVAPDARKPVWTLLGTFTPTRAGAQVIAVDHVLGAGALQAVRAQFRHGGAPSDGCSAGDLDDRDDVAFAVSP